MAHPDNGELLALLDGEVEGPEARRLRAHLAECAPCSQEIRRLETVSSSVGDALALLDTPAPPLERARSRFHHGRNLRREPAPADGSAESPPGHRTPRLRGPRFVSRIALPWAASLALLLTAAAASALPGSPVRRWIQDGWAALSGSSAPAPLSVERPGGGSEPAGSGPESGETGAGIPLEGGAVEVRIHGLPAEAGLAVQWIDGAEAWIYAGEGTRFSSVEGRLEAYDPPGDVRVVIPLAAQEVTLFLDGSPLLRKTGGEMEVLGPVQERTPSEIRFQAPEGPNATGSPGVGES